MENNNGRGIFYGVIGVATLVVAIIGATFAYFSAFTNSDEDAVTAGAASVSLKWGEIDTGLKDKLIPVNSENTLFGSKYVGLTKCVDENGNNICSVYQYSVQNPGSAAQQVYFKLKVNDNDFQADANNGNESNLHFAIFKGAAASIASYDFTGDGKVVADSDAVGTLIVPPTSITGNEDITLTNLNELIAANETVYYTVVLWVEDTGKAQNADQGAQFSGGIFYTTENGSDTGLTGYLKA